MENVLLISGPSGSGKSTFLTQLQRRELPADILSLLPAGAAEWSPVEANDLIKQEHRPNRASSTIKNLNAPAIIAHYDTHLVRHYGADGYSSDPASKIWAEAQHLYIVDIVVDRARVQRQFEDRLKQQRAGKSLASRLWQRLVRQPVASTKALLRNNPATATRDLYNDSASFDQLENDWREYVNTLAMQENCLRLIRLTPASDESQTFTLLDNEAR